MNAVLHARLVSREHGRGHARGKRKIDERARRRERLRDDGGTFNMQRALEVRLQVVLYLAVRVRGATIDERHATGDVPQPRDFAAVEQTLYLEKHQLPLS